MTLANLCPQICEIEPEDGQTVQEMIQELADFEKLGDQMELTAANLEDYIKNGQIKGFLIKDKDDQTIVMAMILFYTAFSSWKGPFYYLEDIYVRSEYRKMKLGEKLFSAMVAKAKQDNIKKINWTVLKWNTPAVKFYGKIGAENLTETEDRLVMSLDEERLEKFAL
uniref:N-acetyltransferase domain-containing protein n=1 Tax=Rhabditophanes sp. KR3021 TaxID=114890 RepID=A0AC35TPD1_9BILA